MSTPKYCLTMWVYLLAKHSVTLYTSFATYEQRIYKQRNIPATQQKAYVYSQILSCNVDAYSDEDNVFDQTLRHNYPPDKVW